MAKSAAQTPDAYVAELPAERAREVEAVRVLINAAIPPGYVERMAWGMISWDVPMEISGPTYNQQPLSYVAFAAQAKHLALYLNCVDASDDRASRLRAAFAEHGSRFDMGKSCLRFGKAADLPGEAIAAEIASTTPAQFVERYRQSRAGVSAS